MLELNLFRPHQQALADFHNDFFRDFAPAFFNVTADTGAAHPSDRTTHWSAAQVSETAEAVVITLDVPGVEHKDLDIKVEGDTLTLKAEGSRAFTRQFTLANTVDPDKTVAALKNGVLTVTLPKREEVKPKTIQVQIA